MSTYWIHFKVDELAAGQCYDNLTHVYCTPLNCLLARSFPLVHTLVRADVSDTIRINLKCIGQNNTPQSDVTSKCRKGMQS